MYVDPFSVLNVAYKAPEDKEDKDCRVNFSIPVSDSNPENTCAARVTILCLTHYCFGMVQYIYRLFGFTSIKRYGIGSLT